MLKLFSNMELISPINHSTLPIHITDLLDKHPHLSTLFLNKIEQLLKMLPLNKLLSLLPLELPLLIIKLMFLSLKWLSNILNFFKSKMKILLIKLN